MNLRSEELGVRSHLILDFGMRIFGFEEKFLLLLQLSTGRRPQSLVRRLLDFRSYP